MTDGPSFHRQAITRLALVTAVCLPVASDASAYTPDQQTFEALDKPAPGTAPAKATCGVCHGSSMKTLNPYGRHIARAFGTTKSRGAEAYQRIKGLDSDGGGFPDVAALPKGRHPGILNSS